MAKSIGVEWKDFLKLSETEKALLKSLKVPIRNKPKKDFKPNGKPVNHHLKSYTVCYHTTCDLCETETVQWFQLDPDPYAPGEALSSRPLNPMNYNRLLGKHRESDVAVCAFCRETLEELDKEVLIDKVINLQRAYRGVLGRHE